MTHCGDREYKFRILVWPNITYQQDLSKDSYVATLKRIIASIRKSRSDIHWTVVTPSEIPDLASDDIETIVYALPSSPNLMRCHFDALTLESRLKLRTNSFDVLYSHLPEQTASLVNLIYNYSGWRPKIIGYCHWFEFPENAQYKRNLLRSNLNGILEMEECGVNSMWIKNRVLAEASQIFSPTVVDQLERIIQPHYLGTDCDFSPSAHPPLPKSILFNHRRDKYTGWKHFLKLMDKLWTKRRDFTVYLTFSEECPESKPYLKKESLPKDKYLAFLKRMTVGVGMFRGYSAWSLSVMDGFGRGLPYLLPNDLCYPEMVGEDYPLLYDSDDEFLRKLEEALDNPHFKKSHLTTVRAIAEKYDWDKRIASWFDGWKVFESFRKMEKSKTYSEILGLIRREGEISTNQLINHFGWGRSVDYAFYRNRLRDEDSVILTKSGYRVRAP